MADARSSVEIQNATPAQRDLFRRIIEWDMSREKEYCANRLGYSHPEHLNRMEIEYKRFVFLLCTYHELSLPISQKVDDLWHAHILNVRRYVEFCNHVFGRLLYHRPTVSDDENAALQPTYQKHTLPLYQQHFGPLNDFWASAVAAEPCCTH